MHAQPALSSRFRWSRWWCCSRFSRWWWWWWCCLQRCNFIVRGKNATKSIRTTLICHLTRYLDNFDICIQLRRGGMGMRKGRTVNGSQQQWQLKAGPSIKPNRNAVGSMKRKKTQKEKEKQIKVGKGQDDYICGVSAFFWGPNAVNCRANIVY